MSYEIKPLEWQEVGRSIHRAGTEFGAYHIEKVRDYWFTMAPCGSLPESRLHDQDYLEAAKAAAEAHWQTRLKSCLIEVKTPCVRECVLDPATQTCTGCRRTMTEIESAT